jgi:hypothetical protein
MMKEEDCQGMLRITKTRITFFSDQTLRGAKKSYYQFLLI